MPSRRSRLLLPLLVLGACAGPGASRADDGADDLEGFPAQATLGPVHVEARYYLDQPWIFGGDLVDGFSIVPVALRMGLVEGSLETVEVPADPEHMDLVLLLADGTPLQRVDPRRLDVRRRRYERLVQEALGGGLLPHWTAAREGFVYFAVPRGVRIDPLDLSVRRSVAGHGRTLDLFDSVVCMQLPIDGRLRAIHVGLQPDRSSPTRLSRRKASTL